MKRYNVAISIAAAENMSIWGSGLNQNLAFLALALRKSPAVDKIWLVQADAPAELPPGLAFSGLDFPLVRPDQITYDVDLVIEFGSSLPVEWLRHVRALGARITAFLVGHTYPGQAELAIFNRPGGTAFIGTPWHELWTLEHHMKTSAAFLRTVARVPVHAMPHIWSPLFLEEPIRSATAMGLRFGFAPPVAGEPPKPWRIAIFEPNITVVKNCFIPMLVCDQAYRTEHGAVGYMMVLNAFHMKTHRTFQSFAMHMDLTRDSKASYEPRLPFVTCMAEHRMDAVVAHQWQCGLNYAYYDALYGGYPLIHNSEELRASGMGFFYPDFEAKAGARALLEAWHQDPAFWPEYKRKSLEFLAGLHPEHPAQVETFTRRIMKLMGEEVEQAA